MDVQSLGCRLPPGLSLIKVASHQKEPKTPHEISGTTNKIMNYPDWLGYLLLLLILTYAGAPERIGYTGTKFILYKSGGEAIIVKGGFFSESAMHCCR